MVSGSLSNFSSAVNKTGGSVNALYELIEKSQDFLMRNVHSLDSILDDFDIAKFGILHAAVIHVKYISQSVVDKEWLIIQTQNFFNYCCPESLQKVPSYVRIISHEFTNCLINMEVPHKGISCMITAIRKLQKCLGQLTPLHCDLCQLALAAKLEAAADPTIFLFQFCHYKQHYHYKIF
uniref:COP9 signalosome complex subunit 3 () n=1 Tax=Schistosoma japonicum TaxID=6182 RepID=C7TYN8_SCHJA|nr:COP9 signalosome complex subunit 3 ( [Schistosoma japonicum]